MLPLAYAMFGPCIELLIVSVELSSLWIILYPSLKNLPSLHHNEIRDLIARLLTEVCHQVQVEPVSDPGPFSLSTANTQEAACWTLL